MPSKRLTTVVDQIQLPSPRTSPMRFKSPVSPLIGCLASSSFPLSSPSSSYSSPRSLFPLGRRKPSLPTPLSIKLTLPTADAPSFSCAHSPSSSSPSSLLSSPLWPPSSPPSCSPSSKTYSCRRAPSSTSRLHWAPACWPSCGLHRHSISLLSSSSLAHAAPRAAVAERRVSS